MGDRPAEELRRQFGSLIRQRRRSLEPPITQQDIAEHLGVAQNTVSDWERGDSWPTIPYLIGLFKLLGLDPAELFGLGENGGAAA